MFNMGVVGRCPKAFGQIVCHYICWLLLLFCRIADTAYSRMHKNKVHIWIHLNIKTSWKDIPTWNITGQCLKHISHNYRLLECQHHHLCMYKMCEFLNLSCNFVIGCSDTKLFKYSSLSTHCDV